MYSNDTKTSHNSPKNNNLSNIDIKPLNRLSEHQLYQSTENMLELRKVKLYQEVRMDNKALKQHKEKWASKLFPAENKKINDILKILDERSKKVSNQNFNRLLFSHILVENIQMIEKFQKSNALFELTPEQFYDKKIRENGDIDQERFFWAYVQTYENLKANQYLTTKYYTELTELLRKLEIERDDRSNKSISTSRVIVDVLNIRPFNDEEKNQASLNNITKSVELLLGPSSSKDQTQAEFAKIDIHVDKKNNFVTLPTKGNVNDLKLFIYVDSSILLECLDIKTIKDHHEMREYKIANIGEIDVDIIWIQNEYNYINNKIRELEAELSILKKKYYVLKTTLKEMNDPFKDEIAEVFEDPFVFPEKDTYLTNIGEDKNLLVRKELEVATAVDRMITDFSGNKIFYLEKYGFILNKLIMLCCIVGFYYRSDFPTLLFCSSVLALEFNLLSRTNYTNILILLLITFIVDLFWGFYFLRVKFNFFK